MKLHQDFREFIELLNVHKVKYLVIGGYAVNFHGYPRYTKDIDFWIWMEKENVHKLLTVIKEFGFGSLKLNEEDFLVEDNIIQLGHEPYRIDILVALEKLEFEETYKFRKTIEKDGIEVNFIGIKELIQSKKAAGRLQDLADAEQLENIYNKNNQK